ncbi:MAG: DUF917 domain-containing protein [Thermoplasmata archaeon]
MKIFTEKQIDQLILGLSFFSTGGGGLPERGRKRLIYALKKNNYLEFLPPNDLDDDSISICTFYMGSASPDTEEIIRKRKSFNFNNIIYENPIIRAIDILENYLNEKIDSVISLETGAGTTSGSFSASSLLGKYFIDGDYAGRSIPEIYQTTPYLFEKSFTPMSAVDKFGNEILITNSNSVISLERIGKMLSESSFTSIGMAGIIMKIKELKDIYIPGTISKALEIGEIIYENSENILKKLENTITFFILFEGKLIRRDWTNNNGYMEGYQYFQGTGEYENKTLSIWFRNENHIAWINGEIVASSPDLIIVLKKDNLFPLNNTDMEVGEKVLVISVPANEKLRSSKSIEILGPRHFSFNYDYIPIEKILS